MKNIKFLTVLLLSSILVGNFASVALAVEPKVVTTARQGSNQSSIPPFPGSNETVEILEAKAEAGDKKAQLDFAWSLLMGKSAEKEKSQTAFRWVERSAGAGYEPAIYELGWLYRTGIWIAKDPMKGFNCIAKAARQGDPRAEAALAQMYQAGEGITRNVFQAFWWAKRSAWKGFPPAEDLIGWYYEKGIGVEKDLREAVKWYSSAASKGDSEGQTHLANCYVNGIVVPKDLGKAASLFRQAAFQGDSSAQNNLGVLYANGFGVPKDTTEAYAWFLLAASRNHENARLAVEKLDDTLSPEERLKGSNLARGYQAKVETRRRL